MIGKEAQEKVDKLIVGLCDFFLRRLEDKKPIVLEDLYALTRLIVAANGKPDFVTFLPNIQVKQPADVDMVVRKISSAIEEQISKGAYV